MRPIPKPIVQLRAEIKTVRTLGKESRNTVLMVESSATAEPTPNTDIIKKNSTENNWNSKYFYEIKVES